MTNGASKHFHTVVIGAGSGGLTVATGLARLGKPVALVERGRIGGDCTNVGCIPSKTLIHLADAYASGSGQASGADVLAAVRARRDRLWQEEESWIEDIEGLEVVRGTGRLAGPRAVNVALDGGRSRELAADHIVLATGSRPIRIDIDGLPSHRRHTNESIFDLDVPPRHLAIVGAGVIGSELAFAFRKLGSAVTMIDMADRPLVAFEPEVSHLMRDRFREAGIELILGAKASSWSETERALHLSGATGNSLVQGVDVVLLAIGRRPNRDDLGLEAIGLEPGGSSPNGSSSPGGGSGNPGIRTNAFGRTEVDTVYAIGDVTSRSAFTHTANAQGRRLVRKLAFPWLPVGREGAWPAAAFTDPEVARVGPTRAELAELLPDAMIRTVRIDLADTDRGYTMELEHGFLLVHAMRLTGRVLSATIVGPHASEMLPLLTHAVNRGPSLYRLSSHVFAYPTFMESVRKASDAFMFDTLRSLPAEAWNYVQHRFRRPSGATGKRAGPS